MPSLNIAIRNGAFKTVEEIMEISGIGEKTFEKFKDQIYCPLKLGIVHMKIIFNKLMI